MARFWEFQALQDNWKGTSYFDTIPKAPNLYIGGLAALYQETPNPFEKHKITHVLSVLDFDIGDAKTKQLAGLKHLHVRVEDHPEENLVKHFERTNAFIEDALGKGGAVFVHCAMGVSRSATVVCAYLMCKFGIGRDEAVAWVREGRERINPNVGFHDQLGLYERMLKVGGKEEREKLFEQWRKGRYPPTKL